MKILNVNLNKIYFSSIALRAHAEDAINIETLAKDINLRGLLNLPSLVPNPHEEGTYHVIDGARRIAALKLNVEAGLAEDAFSFQIKDAQEEIETLCDQIAGNSTSLQTTKPEYIQALHRIATETDKSVADIAIQAGLTESYIWKLFGTLHLPKEILERAKEEGCKITNLISLGELAGKISDEEMHVFFDDAKAKTIKDFGLEVNTKLEEVKAALKDTPAKPKTFECVDKFIGRDDLALMKVKVLADFDAEGSDYNAGRADLMREIYQVDEISFDARKADYDKVLADRKQAAIDRKNKRENAKLEDSKAELEKQGYTVTK